MITGNRKIFEVRYGEDPSDPKANFSRAFGSIPAHYRNARAAGVMAAGRGAYGSAETAVDDALLDAVMDDMSLEAARRTALERVIAVPDIAAFMGGLPTQELVGAGTK